MATDMSTRATGTSSSLTQMVERRGRSPMVRSTTAHPSGRPTESPSSSRRIAPPDAEYNPLESEIYEVALATGATKQLTHRKGPDSSPAVSPDGKLIAYSGFDDREQAYQVTHLYVMNRDGSESRMLAPTLDRDVYGGAWSADGTGLYVQYDDEGDTKLAFVPLAGDVRKLADKLGGLSIDRPSGGAQFSVAKDGRFAFTLAGPDHPADLATGKAGAPIVRVTKLNDDIWAKRRAATVEEISFNSSFDQRRIQGWITKPADFDPRKKYPLMLEIHGGPDDNYGARFAAHNQLYAADGFVVLSANPRGSTSYGEEFGNLIYRDYPDHDYDDLLSGVDAVIARGYVSPDSLFVTGGSGGGILTAWIVGHTQRFRRGGGVETGDQLGECRAHDRHPPVFRALYVRQNAVGGSGPVSPALSVDVRRQCHHANDGDHGRRGLPRAVVGGRAVLHGAQVAQDSGGDAAHPRRIARH